MPLTMNVTDHWSDGKRIHVTGTLTASGAYPAGGDTLPFNDPRIKSNSAPVMAIAFGLAGYNYIITPLGTVLPGAVVTPKFRVFVTSTGLELAAAAYPAGLIAAPANFYAIFPKFI